MPNATDRPYVPPARPDHIPALPIPGPSFEMIPEHRPFVVHLRDWLSCVALVLASILMGGAIYAGATGMYALSGGGEDPQPVSPAEQSELNWGDTVDPYPTGECIGEVPC